LGVERDTDNFSPQKLKDVSKHFTRSQTWADPLVCPQKWKRDVRFGTWKVRRLYRSVSLTEAARELGRYRLGSVAVQEVRCNKVDTVRTEDYTIFCRKDKSSDKDKNFYTI
jgi:hypothetical protein